MARKDYPVRRALRVRPLRAAASWLRPCLGLAVSWLCLTLPGERVATTWTGEILALVQEIPAGR
jgi:hypothetical protein